MRKKSNNNIARESFQTGYCTMEQKEKSYVLRKISNHDWSQIDIWLESVPKYRSTAAWPFPRGRHWPSASAIRKDSAKA